jgi:soluble lytic murein transglycosylase-like protein
MAAWWFSPPALTIYKGLAMRIFLAFFVGFCFLCLPGHALAEADYRPLIIKAAKHWQVPPKLALAIARVESGLHPWAVNVAGRGYKPQSREEASAIIAEAWAAGRSFDVGLMQINSYWMRRYGLDPHILLDPKKNATMGVWILAKEIERFGLNWQAVASYHTPVAKNPERGRLYALAVIQQMKK